MGGFATPGETLYVVFERIDDPAYKQSPDADFAYASFWSFAQEGPIDYKAELYAGQFLKANATPYNIDSECNLDTIWAREEDKEAFMQLFKDNCLNTAECKLGKDLNFYYRIREYCIDRIQYLNITSPDYILVVGCSEDHVLLFGSEYHKESIGVIVVVIDFISIIIMAFVFSKLSEINQEYLDVIDNALIQMKDFGIRINSLRLDKYTQDARLLKMKVWIHFHNMLYPFADEDNSMEIVDVSFSFYQQPGF